MAIPVYQSSLPQLFVGQVLHGNMYRESATDILISKGGMPFGLGAGLGLYYHEHLQHCKGLLFQVKSTYNDNENADDANAYVESS